MTDENPHKQTNLETIANLTKTSRITALDFGDDDTEILVGRIEPVVKVYQTTRGTITGSHTVESGPVVGLAKFNGKLIAGLADGRIQIGTGETATHLSSGDAMDHMKQCRTSRHLVACGGKERQNNLKVWNLETGDCVYRTKNVPNDFLQLEVPIWDTDIGFIDANCLATCSRHGYVRVYDMRQQRRPIGIFTNEKEQIGYTCLATHGDNVFVGTTTGMAFAFDVRLMKQVLHTYKGFSGSISCVSTDNAGKYLCTSSLDRFVRVHHADTTALQYQCYVKSKATRVLLRECAPKIKEESDSEDDEVAEGIKEEAGDSSDDEFDRMFEQMPTVM